MTGCGRLKEIYIYIYILYRSSASLAVTFICRSLLYKSFLYLYIYLRACIYLYLCAKFIFLPPIVLNIFASIESTKKNILNKVCTSQIYPSIIFSYLLFLVITLASLWQINDACNCNVCIYEWELSIGPFISLFRTWHLANSHGMHTRPGTRYCCPHSLRRPIILGINYSQTPSSVSMAMAKPMSAEVIRRRRHTYTWPRTFGFSRVPL